MSSLQAEPKPEPRLPASEQPTVVGIGASAGGLTALKTFFEHVPADSGLAFVVVVHLSPEHKSHLASLLQPCVRFPIEQVQDASPLEPNRAYIIPPGANISAIDTHLRLSELEKNRGQRAPIDYFFRTLAASHDGQAIAVILSGTGSDGTLGAKEIKAAGGTVIVQDPREAEYDGMPQSAIATGLADFVVPAGQMADIILRLGSTRPRLSIPPEGQEIEKDEQGLLEEIFAIVRDRTDRDFSRYKRSTVLRRIARRMQILYVEDLAAYVERLGRQPEEVTALADDLLITVTNFFRDPQVFERLAKEVIPQLFEGKKPNDYVRAWSVGCATGEEAYSLAILLDEEAERRNASPHIQVFASDLHIPSIEKARQGFYTGDFEADLTPERLRRFFCKEDSGFRVRKDIRDLVVFAYHNILGDPPFSRMDLVCCRNVLIYLERDLHRGVIELLHYALKPDGFLVLGTAEDVDSADLFTTVDSHLRIYRKRNVAGLEPHLPVFPLARTRQAGERRFGALAPRPPASYTVLHNKMLDACAPPSILIGPDDNVVHLSEHAGRYLMHPGGQPTSNVFKLLREGLGAELQPLIEYARNKDKAADSRPVPVGFDGEARQVVVHVRPGEGRDEKGFALVMFEELHPEPSAAAPKSPEDMTPEALTAKVREMDEEVRASRERMATLVEEFQSSQEEMKASSEEVQSANEELRATMEELETSKEELESINQELQTVNQENRRRVEELNQVNGDLNTLLSGAGVSALFLDRELCIRRFTPNMTEVLNVRTTDCGRPISDLTQRLAYAELAGDAQAVLKNLTPVERELEREDGRRFAIRVLPYRTAEDRIEGVVITFADAAGKPRHQNG